MTRPRRFDLIAFDWDGTLFDSTALITRCIQDACRDIGVAVPSDADAAYVIGLGLHDALKHAAPGLPPERYPELGARYRHHYIARQDELVLFDGTLAMLRDLKARNHWLAVATGKGRPGWTRRCRSRAWARCSTPRAPPTRPPASPTRRCCWS
jgi:phosphoglycolate phosphatase